jgi:restriction system protein
MHISSEENVTMLTPGHTAALQAANLRSDDAHWIAIQAQMLSRAGIAPLLASSPSILLQAAITLEGKTDEGRLIQIATVPWFKLIDLTLHDPNALHQLNWREMEMFIASIYEQQGYDVVLTPPSNDGGRDVIATRKGFGSIRIFDQVKKYKPDPVTAHDIRAMLGVLDADKNVSKGIVTTTSDFAPGIFKDAKIMEFVPYRLELRAKNDLLQSLRSIADASKPHP